MPGMELEDLGIGYIRELRRPFTPAAVKWKLQVSPREKSGGGFTNGLAVCHIDARLASDRLNLVLGFAWSSRFSRTDHGLECTIRVGDTVRDDLGWMDDTSQETGAKGEYSDALKRAAVNYGVGVSLYAVPRQYVQAEQLVQRTGPGGKRLWFLPDRTIVVLRDRYARWLLEDGIASFGEPLNHGDVPDSQGDIEADDAEPETEPAGEELGVADLDILRAKARFMAQALADRTGTEYSDLGNLVGAAASEPELTEFYRRFAADLKKAGGDPNRVQELFDQAHSAVA